MLKSLLCFIGLCSCAYAATNNILKVPEDTTDTREVLEGVSAVPEAPDVRDRKEVLREAVIIPESLQIKIDPDDITENSTTIPEALDGVKETREALEGVPAVPEVAEVSRDATIPSEITGCTTETPKVPKINIEFVPQGKEMSGPAKYVTISTTQYGEAKIKSILRATPRSPLNTHVFIGLDGTLTCFVPDNAILWRFSSTGKEIVINKRNNFINILDKNYDNLVDYIMNSHYAIERTDFISAWGGVKGCYDFSINITLQRMVKVSNNELEVRDGYTDENLYQDYQLDVLHNILQALINKGISKKNILGLPEISLSIIAINPSSVFWSQFYERHDGFFCVPKFSTTYKIKDANELKNALLKIGYTNSINLTTNLEVGEDCFFRRAINAFILRYLPTERYRLNGRDGPIVTKESAYAEDNTSFDESIFKFLGGENNRKILDHINRHGRTYVTTLDNLSDALRELGYEKEEGEREKEMIARAVNNESKKLFESSKYHQHTFIYPPAGTCYSKELTYNILRDSYPYILSAIEQISNL